MIAKWLMDSKNTVIFSGAGMSTESGVADFRSKNGLWHGKNPQALASTEARSIILQLRRIHPPIGGVI